ncbi:uncharacterized protein LOC143076365 [Mytilus galloprovincialis]|uniref:uncharacterized protein LOC143076365 n=1 Tax=Mytilus galloprovincialis TaxID=29158 RepID=UPI003F7B8445
MEKFDIIVERESTTSYYLPCMIDRSNTVEEIKKGFHLENFHCSPWLVFEFIFLPIAYYNHILFSYIRKHTVCEVNGHPALYTGKAVVFLDESKFERLIICFSRNAISLQIWESKPVGDDIYQNIIDELCYKIEELKGEFHKLDYKIKAKCSNGDPSISGGRISYEDLTIICKDGEYVCEEHGNRHSKDEIENTWLKHNPTTSHSTLQTEHSEVRENLRKLQDSHSKLQAEHTEVTELLIDPIPWNIRGRIKEELETWTEDDKMFIETNGAKSVLKCIKENGCVVVTGSSGTGKSSLVRHVALQMQEGGYVIFPVTSPKEIIKWYNPRKKILFVVDDFCGTYTINPTKLESWKNLMEKIKTLIEKKPVKLIMSCRLQVFKSEKMKSLSFCQSCECNLLSEDIRLSKEENQSIAELYLKTNAFKIKEYYDMFDCFPLLCKLYSKNTNLRMVDFFRNPFTVYKEEIDKLQTEGAHAKYCALALCVMFNNSFKEEWLTDDVNKDIKTIIKNTFEACKVVKGTSRLVLRDELDSLTHTFIRKDGDVYRTIHNKLFDFLAFYFGRVMIYCLIKNASSQFICERFVFEDKGNRDEFLINVSERYQQMYINRLVDDWFRGKIVDVFCNINMDDQIFKQRILVHLKGLEILKQKQLASLYDKQNNSTSLLQCCYIGDIDLVAWCLYHCNSNVNYCRKDGVSPLFFACQEGHTEVVQMLINNKADINKCRDVGASPLFIACQKGHTEVVQMLINNKADINKCTDTGISPLFVACQEGHTEIVQMLINNRADINKCTDNGTSPLFVACQEGHTEVVHMLINNKADINKCNDDGGSPLFIACQKGHTEVVQMLINNKGDIDKCTRTGESPILIACYIGHIEIVELLLKHEADCNIKWRGLTLLDIASRENHTNIVHLLQKLEIICIRSSANMIK